jgi:hypothetical protein
VKETCPRFSMFFAPSPFVRVRPGVRHGTAGAAERPCFRKAGRQFAATLSFLRVQVQFPLSYSQLQ